MENYIELMNDTGDSLIYQSFVSVFKDKQIDEELPKGFFEKEKIADALIILEQKRCLGGACNKIFSRDIIESNFDSIEKLVEYIKSRLSE